MTSSLIARLHISMDREPSGNGWPGHPPARRSACTPVLSLRLAEGDQALLAFVPEGEADAAEALQEGEAAGAGELGMVAQHPRQTIVGDATGKVVDVVDADRSEEHTSELQSLMRISYAVFCLKKKTNTSTKKC